MKNLNQEYKKFLKISDTTQNKVPEEWHEGSYMLRSHRQ